MTDLTRLGGALATSYELQRDDGNGGDFIEVIGNSIGAPYTLNSYKITSSIQSGKTYRVRYRVANVHGFGAFSDFESI